MKIPLFTAALLLISANAFAGPTCTDGRAPNWIPEDQMKQQILDDGYKIKLFKVTSGGCYEIYGWDQQQRKVEIYFHPVSGDIVKQKIKG